MFNKKKAKKSPDKRNRLRAGTFKCNKNIRDLDAQLSPGMKKKNMIKNTTHSVSREFTQYHFTDDSLFNSNTIRIMSEIGF